MDRTIDCGSISRGSNPLGDAKRKGDGSGICRGLSQSGAMGLYVADKIIEKM